MQDGPRIDDGPAPYAPRPENGLVRQETFKMIIRSEVVGCGCRSELTATITTVVSR
jgi:hypothetical protein